MPALSIPSFPVPGERGKRQADEQDVDPDMGLVDESGDVPGFEGDDVAGEPPAETMELADVFEEAKGDAQALSAAVRDVARRLRLSPEDRDMLTDFEVLQRLCEALAAPPVEWRGPVMMSFCHVLPEVCRKSTHNRGTLRDAGAVDAVVELLRAALAAGDEAACVAAAVGLTALCTANDACKKAAAKLKGEFNEEELVASGADYRTPLFKASENSGALDLLLEAMSAFPDSPSLQTQACGALRTMLCDDDSRQATCVPSAVENRERAVGDAHFPAYRKVIERGLALSLITEQRIPRLRLREQVLLLLRELACRQDRIKELVYEAKLLPHISAALQEGDERLVRASLAVIRAFAFSDELKEQLAVESDVALRCVTVCREYLSCAPIVEQAFGLFANLTMRKPHIATRLNESEFRVVAVAQLVLVQYRNNPNVVKSALQTLRNVAKQDEAAALEIKESDLFTEMRTLVSEHQDDGKWRSPVEIAKQFLREFRADDGLRKAAEWNDYY